jgi:acetyl esterase/lipase
LRAGLLAQKRKLTESQTTGEVNYVEEDKHIPVLDGVSIAVRIHKPKVPPKDGSPIFVVYHGGGFVLGELDSEVLLCRKFTQLGGIAVNVDYRMAPGNPFPTPINDAYDALKWVRGCDAS